MSEDRRTWAYPPKGGEGRIFDTPEAIPKGWSTTPSEQQLSAVSAVQGLAPGASIEIPEAEGASEAERLATRVVNLEGELAVRQERIVELEGRVAEQDKELGEAADAFDRHKARIAELEAEAALLRVPATPAAAAGRRAA